MKYIHKIYEYDPSKDYTQEKDEAAYKKFREILDKSQKFIFDDTEEILRNKFGININLDEYIVFNKEIFKNALDDMWTDIVRVVEFHPASPTSLKFHAYFIVWFIKRKPYQLKQDFLLVDEKINELAKCLEPLEFQARKAIGKNKIKLQNEIRSKSIEIGLDQLVRLRQSLYYFNEYICSRFPFSSIFSAPACESQKFAEFEERMLEEQNNFFYFLMFRDITPKGIESYFRMATVHPLRKPKLKFI